MWSVGSGAIACNQGSTETQLNSGPGLGDAWSAAVTANVVTASVETVPVPSSGDAADDPAIWLHPTDLSKSTVIGTNKQGGIAVYDLAGQQLQYRADGKINNIDVRYGFPLGGAKVALVGGTNRSNRTLQFWKVNADRTLSTIGSVAVSAAVRDAYGFTLYRSTPTGRYYAFVVDKNSGIIEQYELDGSTGAVRGTMVRQMDNGNITEGLVTDDTHGYLYASEERVALWRYSAEPSGGATRAKVASAGANDLAADLEGVSIYRRSDGTGYLLLSSQGNSTYAVFDRLPPNAYRGSFRVGAGAAIDATSDTDGLDVTNMNLGGAFPEGFFVAQDGANPGANQNFKLVSWGSIARSLLLGIDTSFDPRAIPGGPATGNTLVATNAIWKYLDNGSDAGTSWRELGFDDGNWKFGPAELGYGDGDVATVVGYGPSATNKYVTTYFRHRFDIPTVPSYPSIVLRLKRDDGAVAYLNGAEVYRSNMPAGAIGFSTLAVASASETTFYTVTLPGSAIRQGSNVLAIEVHQNQRASSDISMVAELIGR